jgi:hypothetical protein
LYSNTCAASTDGSPHSDQLVLTHKLPVWERLHGFWRTLPNFNPHAVSSEPGQDLEGEARDLIYPSRRNDNSSEDEPEANIGGDEDDDASLFDMIEGAAGAMDLDLGLEGLDNNAPDKVRDWAILSGLC